MKTPQLTIPTFFFFSRTKKSAAKKEPEEFDYDDWVDVNIEAHKRILVAETIERALASTIWAHREIEPEYQSFYVTSVVSREVEDMDGDVVEGEYWLFVELTERNREREPFHIVLHQFLEECYALGDLTFSDFDA